MSVDFSVYLIDEESSEKVTMQQFNQFIDAAQSALNNIESDQIVDDSIELDKIEGGAVPESDVSAAGAVNSIVKTDASGNITLLDGAGIQVIAS